MYTNDPIVKEMINEVGSKTIVVMSLNDFHVLKNLLTQDQKDYLEKEGIEGHWYKFE